MRTCLGLKNINNEDIINHFIDSGNNLFDCSPIYSGILNLKNVLNSKKHFRQNIYIHSKLWLNEFGNNRIYDTHNWGKKDILYHTKNIINNLDCEYIDCLSIHWPLKLDNDNISDEFIIPEIWIQMERLVNLGLVKKIGLSNFGILDIQYILHICTIKPYVNQIEVSLFCNNNNVIEFCRKNGILVMAHSIFRNDTLNLDVLNYLEKKYNATKYQILLNWISRKDVIPIISTSKIEHLNNNLLFNNFILSHEDLLQLERINVNKQLITRDYSIHNLDHDIEYNFHRNFEIIYCDNEKLEFKSIFTNEKDFLNKCKLSLTSGPGYIIIKNLFGYKINDFNDKLPSYKDINNKWNGNVIDRDLIFCKLIDNLLIKIIIESLLGWDCHLDNVAFSYSKMDGTSFGPHIDSPFDMKPGAKLPPYEYPLVLQCLYVFDKMTEQNGCFYTIPYSHKKQLRCNLFSEGNLTFGEVPKNINLHKVEAEPGDVLICLGNVWHGCIENYKKIPRRILLAEFVSSIIEKRDQIDNGMVKNMNILSKCSRRFIRILNEGRAKWRFPPELFYEWKTFQNKLDINKYIHE